MELFSEVYGCYYSVIGSILEKSKKGITREEIENITNENAFYDSAFQMLPKLFSGQWNLMDKKADKYYSKIESGSTKRPLTNLEKSWIKSIILDRRIKLFMEDDKVNCLLEELKDVLPLYDEKDFHVFDNALDGDCYEDENYRLNFRTALKCFQNKQLINVRYKVDLEVKTIKNVYIWKINYSNRDDKFRLIGFIVINGKIARKVTLNFGKIISVEVVDNVDNVNNFVDNYVDKLEAFTTVNNLVPITVELSKERNALERFMLQFASWEKQTEYDQESDKYICKLFYDKQDETEILIRMLSFGPVLKVLAPEEFLSQVRERIFKQFEFNENFRA